RRRCGALRPRHRPRSRQDHRRRHPRRAREEGGALRRVCRGAVDGARARGVRSRPPVESAHAAAGGGDGGTSRRGRMTAARSTRPPPSRAAERLKAFHEEETITKTYDVSLVKRLWPFLAPHSKFVVASLVALVLLAASSLIRPLVM